MRQRDAINSLLRFYFELEDISNRHDELTDTDVREAIHLTLNRFFIWGHEHKKMPKSYGMFSQGGDSEVAVALEKFLNDPAIRKIENILPVGEERLRFLQDATVQTKNGSLYDNFIGHVDQPLPDQSLPKHMFQEGEYDYD